MMLNDLAMTVASHLVEEMKTLAMGFKSFPFYIHCSGSSNDRGRFTLYWTTKREHFATPDRCDVVSELYCTLIATHDSRILLDAQAMHHRVYHGQEIPKSYYDNDWYKQAWRQDRFLIEAKAPALWTIMEAHANFDRVAAAVHEG